MSAPDRDWWRGAVIYQIYPRSFMDASGDGVGDLAGVVAKLDYVAGLNVDAVWLSPFFTSPMKDFGYDVSDYRDVDPLFGTLEDFDRLIARAHELGLKVMIDQVLSHTSDQHPWFAASRAGASDYADWYVWADPKPDGTPPNNWLSIFGGPAWQWESRRRQYYLHNFLVSQPDLNFHNPAVRAALLDDVEFWLKRGVDGFRLDTANFFFHDPELRDNPARPADERAGRGLSDDNPYALQIHRYDITRPENVGFLRQLRALLERYPGTATVGEISAENSLAVMADYTSGGDKLHMAYSFELLTGESDGGHVRATVEALEAAIGDGWPCWSLNNHDVQRVMTRWGDGDDSDPGYAKLLMAMLTSLRGSVCLYQGEELGLAEAELGLHELQDPYGIEFWPEYKGRDGCRTPLPWTAAGVAAGFSDAQPWLPVPEPQRARAVDVQDHLPGSVLNAYRRFLGWRRRQPALRGGDIVFLDAPERTLAFVRAGGGQRLLVCLNLSARSAVVPLRLNGRLRALDGHGFAGSLDEARAELPAYGALFAEISDA